MLRLTEVKLPLDHPESAIQRAVLERLGIAPDELLGYSIFRRGYDARRPAAVVFIYTLDVEVKDEAALLEQWRGDRQISRAPDTSYQFVTQAPSGFTRR